MNLPRRVARLVGVFALPAAFAAAVDAQVRRTVVVPLAHIVAAALAFHLELARHRQMMLRRLARGDVTFGGRIDKQGYLPGQIDINMTGTGMRLRLAEGMQSLVDAQLSLQGTMQAATLSGRVTVNDAVYSRPFSSNGGLLDLATGEVTPATAPAEPTIPLRYDIRITAPQTLQVRNSALRLNASADLQPQGTFDRPLLFGRAEAQRGESSSRGGATC